MERKIPVDEAMQRRRQDPMQPRRGELVLGVPRIEQVERLIGQIEAGADV